MRRFWRTVSVICCNVVIVRQVGQFLSRYKSGRLPKVFKLLPGLTNWEDLLYITKPEEWSAHAVFAATRIFASNLSAAMAQRYRATPAAL